MSQPSTTNSSTPQAVALLPDAWYQWARRLAIVLLPALGTLYFGLSQIWGFPAGDKVNGTIAVLNLFVGAVAAASKTVYDKTLKYAGTFALEPGMDEDSSQLRLLNVDLAALIDKDEVTFKVLRR